MVSLRRRGSRGSITRGGLLFERERVREICVDGCRDVGMKV